MKIFTISICLFLIIITFGFKLILIMSYTNIDAVMRKKNELIDSSHFLKRNMGMLFYFFIANRFTFGWLSILGLLSAIIAK